LPEQPETLEKPAPAIPKKKKWNKKPAITIAAGVLLLASGVVLCCWVFSRSSTAERSESKREGIPTLSNLDKNLFQAVRDGDMDLVYRYLREGANINAVNNVGNTPIKVAIALNRVDIARELCDEGGASSFTSFTQGRSSPLIYAIVQNKPEIIRELLKSITDAKKIVNEIDRNGLTPLMYAVDRNYVAVARELLRAGADVDKPNKEGYTPLMTAVTVGKADMVAVLLDAGADTKAISPEGETALSIARRRNKQVIISLLSEAQQSRLL
jgi:ankyrin repeat protein